MQAFNLRPRKPEHVCRFQSWGCDDVSLLQMWRVVKDRGHLLLYHDPPLELIVLDLGGMISVDEPTLTITAEGVSVQFMAIHADEICAYLATDRCIPGDAPHLMQLPNRWVKTFVCKALGAAVLAEITRVQAEASRLADISYKRRDEMLKRINKDGVKILVAPHSHHPPESEN